MSFFISDALAEDTGLGPVILQGNYNLNDDIVEIPQESGLNGMLFLLLVLLIILYFVFRWVKRDSKTSYVEDNLMLGEALIYTAKIHWFVYFTTFLAFGIGIMLHISALMDSYLTEFDANVGTFGAVMYMLLAPLMFLNAIIIRSTTELAITSKRVIAKTGFIQRNTMELNHSKVESFNVDQSIFGRMFGFGSIVINGTGGGKTKIPCIVSPLDFRRKAMEVIDQSQQ